MDTTWWQFPVLLFGGLSLAFLLPVVIVARIRRRRLERSKKTMAAMLDRFKTEVCEKSTLVDPESQRDWFCLSYGFFLACGATPSEAYALAVEAKEHEYWS